MAAIASFACSMQNFRPAASATHLASGIARVIPTTIEEGEADGTASAVALRDGIYFAQLAAHAATRATRARR